jgi:hypothetical protein
MDFTIGLFDSVCAERALIFFPLKMCPGLAVDQ